ncbi:hypothetical protein CTV99_13995 [Bacillus pumilus]|uniref:Uncharacterized protein n=1 Tax=Bacillus pumilus TaxID=1408 RepID=A0A2G8IRQ1_BACPU|nr:hypothetical protein CTV99_13995 [Bacillus pumilus]
MQKLSTKESTAKKRTGSFKGIQFFFYIKWDYIESYFKKNGLESYKKGVNHGTIMKDNVGKEV